MIVWSLIVLAVLPDSPATSQRWFNETERAILAQRMRGSLAGADVRVTKKAQVFEALRDVKIWLMGAMGAAIYVCNGGVTAFGSLIIKVSYSPALCESRSSPITSLSVTPAYELFSCKPLAVLLPVFPST